MHYYYTLVLAINTRNFRSAFILPQHTQTRRGKFYRSLYHVIYFIRRLDFRYHVSVFVTSETDDHFFAELEIAAYRRCLFRGCPYF
jgi:hypothetical protein